jgi:hypothetical protein
MFASLLWLCISDILHLPRSWPSAWLRFFAHGLRLSLMSKKVSTFALRHKMVGFIANPEDVRHSLKGEPKAHRPHGNSEMALDGLANPHLAYQPWVTAVPLTSGLQPVVKRQSPVEILPRKTRKSSHCGRVAFSFQSW